MAFKIFLNENVLYTLIEHKVNLELDTIVIQMPKGYKKIKANVSYHIIVCRLNVSNGDDYCIFCNDVEKENVLKHSSDFFSNVKFVYYLSEAERRKVPTELLPLTRSVHSKKFLNPNSKIKVKNLNGYGF